MANALLEEEDADNENDLLLDFYQANRTFLRTVYLHNIPPKIKFDVGALYLTSFDYEWKQFLYDLEVDPISIATIDFKSSKLGVPPLEVALNGSLQSNKSFGNVIEVLCQNEKFHILRLIKPFVEALLKSHQENAINRRVPAHQPSAPDCECGNECGAQLVAKKVEVENTAKNNSGESSLKFQGHEAEEHTIMQDKFQKCENISGLNLEFRTRRSLSVTKPKKINSVDPSLGKPISVFILHSASDRVQVKRLANYLMEKQLKVMSSADISHVLWVNHTKILKVVHEKVDFTIPFISEMFLKQIHAGRTEMKEDDIEIKAIRFMYNLALNEYSSRNCNNFRVRPVCTSLKLRTAVLNDPILSWCFQLWDEVPKLVQNLKLTKRDLFNFRL